MNRNTPEFDQRIADWLEVDPSIAPPDVMATVRAALPSIPQARRGLQAPGRFPFMTAISRATGIAAVALVAIVGAGGILYTSFGGPGGSPTALPTVEPTAIPTPARTPAPIPEGEAMPAGTYFTRPLPAPDDGLTLTFTVPEGWFGFGRGTIFPDTAPHGIALQFLDVTSINDDLCQWKGPDGDVDAGTTVDDLVAALLAQTAYEVSDPVDVSIGGYSGKRVDVVFPAELFEGTDSSAPDCDEGVTRLWSTRGHGELGIYGQAPDERWQANILDVDGTRLIIVAQDDPSHSPADLAAGQAIIDSMVIEP